MRQAIRAIPKWGSAATDRSEASRRLAVCGVAAEPHLGEARMAVEFAGVVEDRKSEGKLRALDCR